MGQSVTATATLLDARLQPLADFPVEFAVRGAHTRSGVQTTDGAGIARFTYTGAMAGLDTITATALGTVQQPRDSKAVQWVPPGTVFHDTQGCLASPVHQSSVTGRVPITLNVGCQLLTGTVDFWPMSNPANVTVLAASVSGNPGDTVATLDTTTLANGPYVIRLVGTKPDLTQFGSLVGVTVTGEFKPGRVVMSINDFTVPLAGLPITIGRTYDSLERNKVGDFGHGWSLSLGNPRLETDPANNVTITEPSGKRATFFFTPTSLSPGYFRFLLSPAYTPDAGVFGTLTSDGCPLIVVSGGRPVCFLDPLEYTPTRYTYTDPYGRVLTISADGKLQSIKDTSGNLLTISDAGITSSAGNVTVPFGRDSQGRITTVTDLEGHVYQYQYDAAGDLVAVVVPTGQHTYTYNPSHLLLHAVDPNGHTPVTSTYTDDGRLETLTDAVGNLTHYAYDLPGRTTTITDPQQGVATMRYDANGLLLQHTDPLNRRTTYVYDSRRLKTSESNPLNETTTFTYDDRGREVSRTDAGGRTWRTSYNGSGQIVTSIDPAGRPFTITYDVNGAPTAFIDPQGALATFTSTRHGLPISITDAAGNTTSLTYNARGDTTGRTDRLGRETTHVYDTMGRVLRTRVPLNGIYEYGYTALGQVAVFKELFLGGLFGPTTNYFYDAVGNLIRQVASPLFGQRQHSFAYDAANRQVSVTNPEGNTRSYTLDFRGNHLTETDESGRVTRFQYDLAGQLEKTIFPDGTFTTVSYDALGRRITTTDERGNATHYEYEAGCGCSDRLTKMTDPLGRITRHSYDALGRRVSTIDPAGRTTSFMYDGRGRLLRTTYPDGSFTESGYDAVGRQTSQTDQAKVVTSHAYDAEGQITSVTDALGHATRYGYDVAGNLASITDANGHTTRMAYLPLGRMQERILPLGTSLGQSRSYEYNGDMGELTHILDKDGGRGYRTLGYRYDVMGRMSVIFVDRTWSFTFTPTSKRASMTDGSSSTTVYLYDERDRLIEKRTPAGTLFYTYDAAGNVGSMRSSHPGGVNVSYAWDAANQLVSVTDNRVSPGLTVASYGLTGQTATVTLPTGVAATYARDSLDRVTSLAHGPAGGAPLASYAYALGPTGRRLSVTEVSGRSASYGYDATYKLTGETVAGDPASHNGAVGYTHDLAGNRLTRSSSLSGVPAAAYAYNANDHLSSDGYDPVGNTVSLDGNTFAYDFLDRPISRNAGGSGEVLLGYDGDGNLESKTVAGVTTRYLIDELNPTGLVQVVEEVVGGAVQRVYTYGSMLTSQGVLSGGSLQTRYYGYDAHGNVTFLTDATGAVTDTYTYDAYGTLVASTGTTPNAYLYGGQRFDADMGLYQLRARWYEPGRGRFVTRDPIDGDTANPLSLNKYLYAHGDPINRNDPTGLFAPSPHPSAPRVGGATGEYANIVEGIAGAVAKPKIVVVGGNPVLAGAAVGVGLVSACQFFRAATGLESIQLAAQGLPSDPSTPPPPFTFCKERARTCSDERFEQLRNLVVRSCAGADKVQDFKTKCAFGMSCKELMIKWGFNRGCEAARRQLTDECFPIFDPGHETPVEAARKQADDCSEIMKLSGCFGPVAR